MPRVIGFQMSAVHPDRAFKFYSDVFGWTFTKWDTSEDRWLVKTGPETESGIDGMLVQHRSPPATRADITMLGIGVTSIDETIGRILGAGGEVVSGATPVEGLGMIATCRDPEANLFQLLQHRIDEEGGAGSPRAGA
jgi:predicted enzyme related to lactoylglutathione lyase